jgi:hypothetical protein
MENKTNEVVVVENNYRLPAMQQKSHRDNYVLTVGDSSTKLVRDVDFGKIVMKTKDGNEKEITSRPTLYKSGAEKILLLYQIYYKTELEKSYEDYENGFFYYVCKTTAYDRDGRVLRVGYGCANTKEKSNGFASGWDTANSMLKKAEKRSVVDLALKVGACSDMFYQDLEDSGNEERASKLSKDDDPITSKQTKRIFAIAGQNNVTIETAKQLLASWGYVSTKDIKQKDYDEVVEKLEKYIAERDGN